MRLLAGLAALAICLAACDAGSPAPGASSGPGGSPVPTRVAQASQPSDPATAAATGPWRRVPFVVDASFGAQQEAGCRNGVVAIPTALARVLTDVRGEGRVLMLFASSTKAFLCVTSIDDPAHPVDVESLTVPAKAIAADGIDLVSYAETGSGSGTIVTAVGRVGPTPTAVIAGFVDQTFVFGAMGGGWYSMWWPVTVACDGISSVNNAHIVLDNTPAPCQGASGPSGSP